MDPPEAVARSRERLLERLGRNVEVPGEIVPELELVTGPLSSPPRVPARESRDRFIWSVTEFLRSSATPGQPAVLFSTTFSGSTRQASSEFSKCWLCSAKKEDRASIHRDVTDQIASNQSRRIRILDVVNALQSSEATQSVPEEPRHIDPPECRGQAALANW